MRDALTDRIVLSAYDAAVGLVPWKDLATRLAELLHGAQVLLALAHVPKRSIELLAMTDTLSSDRLVSCLDRVTTAMARGTSSSEVKWISWAPGSDFAMATHPVTTGREFELFMCLEQFDRDATFDSVGRQQVELILPHLARAVAIGRRLLVVSPPPPVGTAILDRLPFAVFHLGASGMVVYANAPARRIAQARDGLAIGPTGLHATTAADDAALQRAIRQVNGAKDHPSTRRLGLRRTAGSRPYSVLVTTLPDRAKAAPGPECVVFVTDPDNAATINPASIADTFGLTPGESRVAAHLAMGVTLSETATQLGVSINTVRTLLARAMARTGTNSQVSLVRLILTALPLGEDR